MTKPNIDVIDALEKSIKEKYGKEAVTNPKSLWNEEKEKEYLQQLKELYKNKPPDDHMENINGVLLPSKLLIRDENNRNCVSCKIYSFDRRDDLYMNKFQCCFKCYIMHVEGREDKWQQRLK